MADILTFPNPGDPLAVDPSAEKSDVLIVIWRDEGGRPVVTVFDDGHERKSIAFADVDLARRAADLVAKSEQAPIKDMLGRAV